MNSFLLALTAVLIVVLSALFAAPLFIDWNTYRPVFETQAAKLLGREVKVGGKVHLVLLPTPELRFDDVKVADSAGGFEKPFLEASHIEAWLNIGALLHGTLEAKKITMADPVLRLALREDGTGNWRDVGRPGEVFPFAPKDVLLDEVTVSNGRIELARPGKAPLVAEAVTGAASAASLSGPYKLRATYRYADRLQEARLSTSVADAAGKFQAKALLRDAEPGITYLLDGDVTGLNATPNYDGTIVMRSAPASDAAARPVTQPVEEFVEEDAGAAPEASAIGTPAPQPSPVPVSAWELKGELTATPERAEMPSFELTIHNKGRSQALKGRVALDFGERVKADGAIQARWIDADALLGSAGQAELTAAGALSAIAENLLDHAAKIGSGKLSVSFEQAGLGGDLLGALDLAISSEDGILTIERLSAGLPGENRLEASGRLAEGEQGPIFEGPVTLSGSKLRTFIRWAAGARDVSGQTSVGAFSLSAAAKVGGANLELKGASGEVSGTKFSGSLRYAGGDRRVIDLALDSDKLDLREVLGEEFAWSSWVPSSGTSEEATETEQTLFGSLKDDEIRAQLRIGELLLPKIPQGKLDARLTLAKDALSVESLDFASAGAVTLSGRGRLDGLSETPSGQVDFSFRAANAESLKAAAALLGLGQSEGDSKQIAILAPLDIRGSISAARQGNSTDASAELAGTASGSAVSIKAKMKGEIAKLADAEIALDGSVEGDRPQALLGVLFPGLAQAQLTRVGAGSGKLTFKVGGVPSNRMSGAAELATASMHARFEGEGSLKSDGLALTGRTSAKSENAALPLLLIGLHASPSAGQSPLEVETEIVKTGPRIELKGLKGKVAGQDFAAEAHFDVGGEKTRFAFDGKAASASLPALLGALVEWERAPGAENLLGSIAAQGASDVWPARAFALDSLTTSEGEFKLKAGRLSIGEPFQIDGAELLARVDAEGLTISELKGSLFGGNLSASGILMPRGAGAELKVKIGLEAATLENASQALAGSVLAKGPFSLTLDLSGEGLSPPGIVAGLSGEGKLALQPGSVNALSPEPLRRVAAEAARIRKSGLDKDQIAARTNALRDALKRGTYAYEAAELPLKVQNGTLRFEPAPLVNQRAETTVNGFVELASLKIDSEWVMRLNGQEADVPPVSLVFAGPLTNVPAISPAIDTAPIETFLTVRRMQDDVERLERLDVTGRRQPEPEPEPEPAPPAEDPASHEPAADSPGVQDTAAQDPAPEVQTQGTPPESAAVPPTSTPAPAANAIPPAPVPATPPLAPVGEASASPAPAPVPAANASPSVPVTASPPSAPSGEASPTTATAPAATASPSAPVPASPPSAPLGEASATPAPAPAPYQHPPTGQAAVTPAPVVPGTDPLPWVDPNAPLGDGATPATVGPDAAAAETPPPAAPRQRPSRRYEAPDDWKKGIPFFGGG